MKNNPYNSQRKSKEVWKKRGKDKSQKTNLERKGPTNRVPHGNIWRKRSEQRYKDSKKTNLQENEYITPKIDEVDNKGMMGESSNKKSENHNFAYKVDQLQKVPKEEYDTTIDLDNIQKIKSPLVNERKIQTKNLKEENEEHYVVQNNDDDDQIVELSKEDSGSFPTDELLNSHQQKMMN
jgi:hypothetical protein